MSDIIWTINPENDSFEKIIKRMRSLSYNLLHAKNIDFSFRADETLNELTTTMEKRKTFYLIFKEAINNLVKYAEATRVSINLSKSDQLVSLVVRDNGKGFDVKKLSSGNGIKNMKKRAKEINGALTIESQSGEGTTIELKFRPWT